MKNSNKKGFTLVELVVVIAIIGVLAAILVPSMMGYVKKSRLKTANGNAKTAYNGVSEYIADLETEGLLSTADATKAKSAAESELATNGSTSGVVWTDVSGTAMAAQGASTADLTYHVQWARTSSDEIVGQYPDAPQKPEQCTAFGKLYTPSSN